MKTQSLILSLALVGGIIATLASAAVAPKSPADMKREASHVVVGTAQRVFVHKEVVKEFGGSETRTTYLTQLKVESVEKGAGIAAGDIVYVKTWRHKWNGPGTPPPGNIGHWHIPKAGQRLSVFFKKLNGLNHVVLQGGMGAAPASKAAKPDKPAKPTQKAPYEPTSHYTIMNMEGWKVYVNKALLPGGAHGEMGAKAIERLRGDMVLVKHWVADEPLAKLLKVGIWLELDSTNGPHGRTPVFHYHSYLGWLKKMDFHPGKHKCVEYSRAASLVMIRRGKGTARILLHELAHAYHDQVLSFNDPDILAAHKRAREGGKYPRNDRVVRADHKEFFAGVSTRYFGTKEDREALAERDPILLKKLQKVWGKPKAYMDSPPPKGKTSPGQPRSGGAK